MSSQYTQKEKQDALNLAIRDGGFYSEDGTWNSIISFPGDDRIYRGRVETLIVKDFSSVFMKLHDGKYRIPGGSFEKNIPNMEQAVNECREEARINVKNIQSTGISYKEATKPPKWAIEKTLITWNGKYTEVYIAEYDSKYTGKIDPEDVDNDMVKGTFVPIKSALTILSDYHKQALTQWLATHKDDVAEVYKKEQNATLYGAANKEFTESTKNVSAKDIYFLSDKNFDKQILYPRVPNNFFTRKGYEDPSTPRICFCKSISGCLIAMARNLENSELYVHKTVGNPPIHVCTPKEVPDTVITHEIWTTGPTQMKCIGKIKVGRAKDKKLTFRYGDVNTGELTNWNWEWLERYTKQTVTERAKTLTRKQLLEKAWDIIDETGGRSWRKHDGKLVNIKGFLSGETDGILIGSAGKIGAKEMCRLLKNEIPEADFIEDNYNTFSIKVPKGSYISEATHCPSLGYKPLYTNKVVTKQMVDEFGRNRSADLNNDIATMVFESMAFFDVPKDYIKSKNPLYEYIDLWEDANQNLHTIVTERAVTDQDVTYLIQYFDNTIVILGKLLYTLQDILHIAKNTRTEILAKELNIKSKHRKLVAKYLNDIRFNMNKVIFIIKCMKATGYNINRYYDVKLREYNQQMIEYQKSMKKMMQTYDFIRIRLDSEGTTLSKTTAFNLSLLMDSIKGTLNEIQIMLIELS